MERRWKPPLLTLAFYVLAGAVALLALRSLSREGTMKEVSYSGFLIELRAQHLVEVVVSADEVEGRLKPEAAERLGVGRIVAKRLPGFDDTKLLGELQAQPVNVVGRPTGDDGWMLGLFGWMVPLVLVWLLFFGSRRWGQARPDLTFGKNKARIVDESTQGRVTFADVAGVDEAEAELMEVVDFLKHPERHQKLGGRIPKGVLLVGPPGTGKTLLARAVAGEAGVPFFVISGSAFVEMFVGVGAARVRDLFEQAKLRAPCIIFIDELDAVGKSRSGARGLWSGNDEREQTLNQLLAEMDGFDTSKGVIILAATNTPEALDPALLRAGRFDRQVMVDRPDLEGRKAILRVHARGIALASGVDLDTIAARTAGMVGADLANVVNEAALLGARRDAAAVETRDLEEAIDRVLLGLAKKSRVMTAAEKERIACHEAGHALVALSVRHANPVHRVSIIPRTIGALGHTLQLPTHEKFLLTRPELDDELAVILGGRAAEELVYHGAVSTGAADDLGRASELARQMVTRFGMTERLGPVTYGRPSGTRFLPTALEERNYSEASARLIDEEVLGIVEGARQAASAILSARRGDLERVVRELVGKETLGREELLRLLAVATAEAPRSAAAPPVVVDRGVSDEHAGPAERGREPAAALPALP